MSRLHVGCLVLTTAILVHCRLSSAQMVTTHSPLQSNSGSFYEQSNVSWGMSNPHYFINFNGGGANPPFGGYQANAGLHTGFAVGHDHFSLGFAQGASLNSATYAPVLTTTSGFPGFLFMGGQRPFVTGIAPQVAGAGFASVPSDPLTSRMQAGEFRIEKGRVIVPEAADAARRVNLASAVPQLVQAPVPLAAAKTTETASRPAKDLTAGQYLERAEAAEKDGKPGVAKIYYQLAATKGDPYTKAVATAKLDAMKGTAKP